MTMPPLEYGSLASRIKDNGHFRRDEVKTIVRQVLSALKSLHNQSIVHRDIKPANILVQSLNPIRVKVTDYGFAIRSVQARSHVGTRPYVAPEIGSGDEGEGEGGYTQKGDIYSLGLVMLYLLKLRLPRHSPRTKKNWHTSIWALVHRELLRARSQDYTKALHIALAMSAYDPTNRPDVAHCYTLPWFDPNNASEQPFEMPGVPNIGPSRRPPYTPVEEADSEGETEIIHQPSLTKEADSQNEAEAIQKTKRRKRADSTHSASRQAKKK